MLHDQDPNLPPMRAEDILRVVACTCFMALAYAVGIPWAIYYARVGKTNIYIRSVCVPVRRPADLTPCLESLLQFSMPTLTCHPLLAPTDQGQRPERSIRSRARLEAYQSWSARHLIIFPPPYPGV